MTTFTTNSSYTLGDPQIAGPLAVFPVFGPRRRLRYRSLGQATRKGASVSEIRSGASVNDVVVSNPTDQPVLLYEGELILGAQQNRTIDQPVLVAAGAELTVPVSCVEQGRWESSRRDQPFAPAPYAADPALRRAKRATANASAAAGAPARPVQQEVWAAVGDRLGRHEVASPTGAFTDLFDARRRELASLSEAVRPLERQIGAIAQINGRTIALDLVGRPKVFADLLPRLASGYALQALEVKPGAIMEPYAAGAERFLAEVLETPKRWQATPGMGDAFVPEAPGLTGCMLRAEGELIALSAFPADGGKA